MEAIASAAQAEMTGSATSSELCIEGCRVDREGIWIKLARVHDELWLENGAVCEPGLFIAALEKSRCGADLFTFAQALPELEPRFHYHTEWDNISVANTTDFAAWWSSVPQESRKNVRRSQRRGVTVELVELDHALVRGIKVIYDETPVRQGRRFRHYQKTLDAIESENSSYLDRAQFIGAFFDGQLIGFIKMVRVGSTARIMQIISLNAHYDKRPTNALLAKAIETCAQRGLSHLIYGQHVYDNKVDSSVTEFKRRNGFNQVLLPRYYVPLSQKGRLALSLGLHRGLKEKLPPGVRDTLLAVRTAIYQRMASPRSSV